MSEARAPSAYEELAREHARRLVAHLALRGMHLRPDDPLIVGSIHQAITAAIARWERKAVSTTPHRYVGRLDRACEVCGRPDRDPSHIWPPPPPPPAPANVIINEATQRPRAKD